jgi:hypothetical protein
MSSPTSPTPQPIAAPQPAPEISGAPGLSELQRLVNVFIAPSKTFADLKRKASSWWVPFLLLTLAGTAYLITIDKKIGFDAFVQARMAHASAFMQRALDQMPPEQKQEVINRQIQGARRGIYFGALFYLIYGLLAAALLTPTFNFLLDAGVKFKHAFAVVFYGALPRILWLGLGVVTIYAGVNAEGFDQENPVATNPGAFLGVYSDHPYLYRFLTTFDIFFIWIVIVIGLGFVQVASRKISKGSAIAVVAGWYVVMMLCRTALAAIFG